MKEEFEPLLPTQRRKEDISFSYLAGTISKEDISRFKLMIYRGSRGNAYPYFVEQTIHLTADEVKTIVIYVIFFQDGSNTRGKLIKICESFDAFQVQIPSHFEQRDIINRQTKLDKDIRTATAAIKKSRILLREFLCRSQYLLDRESDELI